jgi:hypothetical protein
VAPSAVISRDPYRHHTLTIRSPYAHFTLIMQESLIPYGEGFGIEGNRQTTLGAYIKGMRRKSKSNSNSRSEPRYVFESISRSDDPLAGATGDGLQTAYPWRPKFLQHDHPLQHGLRAVAHQFFVGSIGTGEWALSVCICSRCSQ